MSNDVDNPNNDDGAIPNTSTIGLVLSQPNRSEELILIARNDEHQESMVQDDAFMAQVQERNEQANQLMNLNNADDS